MSRIPIVAALEALEAGDLSLAVETLLGALDDGPTSRRYLCRVCGLGLEWPGLREDHERRVHGLSGAPDSELQVAA